MQIHNDSHAEALCISCISMASGYFYSVSHTEAALLLPFISLVKKREIQQFKHCLCVMTAFIHFYMQFSRQFHFADHGWGPKQLHLSKFSHYVAKSKAQWLGRGVS